MTTRNKTLGFLVLVLLPIEVANAQSRNHMEKDNFASDERTRPETTQLATNKSFTHHASPYREAPTAPKLLGADYTSGVISKGGDDPVYELIWTSIGSRASSEGGDFQLENSTQPFAGVSLGGDFKLTVGFRPIVNNGPIFESGFETGDTSTWSNAQDSIQ